MTKILITGCSGLLGGLVTQLLCDAGHTVYGVRGTSSCNVNSANHHCVSKDLLTCPPEEIIPSGVDVLMLFAWSTKPGYFYNDPLNEKWLAQSVLLVDSFYSCGGSKVLVAGSCAEYDWGTEQPLPENASIAKVLTPYSSSKLDLYSHLETHYASRFIWSRIFFLFGLNEAFGRLIPSIIDSYLLGKEFIPNYPGDVLDFIYAPDAARVLSKLVTSDFSGVINVGSGQGVSVGELSQTIKRLLGSSEFVPIENSLKSKSVVADVTLLKKLIPDLSFTPLEISLRETILARGKV